jgi:hypothetical protein
VARLPENWGSLQQRVLLPIYTAFPFNPENLTSSGTNPETKIFKNVSINR